MIWKNTKAIWNTTMMLISKSSRMMLMSKPSKSSGEDHDHVYVQVLCPNDSQTSMIAISDEIQVVSLKTCKSESFKGTMMSLVKLERGVERGVEHWVERWE